jgi:hypothetical protein
MLDGLNSTPPFGQPSRSTLWCQTCGRFQTCSPASAIRYARIGWPRCCGHAMSNLPTHDRMAAQDLGETNGSETEKPL